MLKVASYCRVSTDNEEQTNSFESQQRSFWEYINRQPDWELYQVYADMYDLRLLQCPAHMVQKDG